MSKLINIFHYGDSQIELRVSGENAQRFAEFDAVFAKLEEDIKLAKPDVIVIPGDVYQYADTNGEEQEMFARHLHKIVDYTRRIVIIPGNHDIKQSNNTIIKDEEKTSLGDSIRSIVVAINNPKIVYYDKSGIFKDDVIGLSWVVWSQKNKHSKLQPKPEYNPWIENSIPEGPFIELFHDPVRNAKAFDGKPSKHFENYAITLNDFKANLILANDIHSPDIIC
jgi:predicted MPP superfamily phosphohydrolase